MLTGTATPAITARTQAAQSPSRTAASVTSTSISGASG